MGFFIKENIWERIQLLIDELANGNVSDFAKNVGIPQTTMQRNLSKKKDNPFLKHVKKICDAYPTVSEEWLYTGEGVMLVAERPHKIRSIVNGRDQLIGDLLWEFFGILSVSLDDVLRICHFDDTFEQVMNSSRFPTLAELETLYDVFGFNPIFLFTASKYDLQSPRTVLERIEQATGLRAGLNERELSRAMGVEKYDLREYYRAYKKSQKERLEYMAMYGSFNAVEMDDDYIYAPSEPNMPHEWLQCLEESYGLPSNYLYGRGRSHMSRSTYSALREELYKIQNEHENLQKSCVILEEKNKELTDTLQRLSTEVAEQNKELRELRKSTRTEKGAQRFASGQRDVNTT